MVEKGCRDREYNVGLIVVILRDIPIRICDTCGEIEWSIENIALLHNLILENITDDGRHYAFQDGQWRKV